MTIDLETLLNQVTDEKSLLVFLAALVQDRVADVRGMKGRAMDDFGRGPAGWENQTLVDFLEATKAWGDTTNIGATHGLESASPWRRFAELLYQGKVYKR